MTDVSDINDLFLTLIEDYRLNSIYQTSGSVVLNQYLEGWLRYSVNEFSPYCTQTLTYNKTSQQFAETLTDENMLVLAQIMTKYWFTKTVQDILQLQNSVQDRDYKTYSQAQNLQAKQQYLNSKKEEISQLLIDYSYKHNTLQWSKWDNQIFNGG